MKRPSSKLVQGSAPCAGRWFRLLGGLIFGAVALMACTAPAGQNPQPSAQVAATLPVAATAVAPSPTPGGQTLQPTAHAPATTATAPAPAPARVLRVAHRGAAGLAPENTLAAFKVGLTYEPDALELDVHLSKDGQLVVIHDPTLARTTNLSGEVVNYTASELAAADAAAKWFGPAPEGPQGVPTLDEVLALAKGRAGVQIEVKVREDKARYPGIEAKLVETLRAHGMLDEIVVISFDFPTLVEIKRLEPRLKTAALISTAYLQGVGRGGPEKVAEEIAALNAEYVGVNYTWLSEPLKSALEGARAAGGRVDGRCSRRHAQIRGHGRRIHHLQPAGFAPRGPGRYVGHALRADVVPRAG